jgi:hypothetical protein
MKPGTPALPAIRPLDQVRERILCLHYSLSTGKAYLHWIELSFGGRLEMAEQCSSRVKWERRKLRRF